MHTKKPSSRWVLYKNAEMPKGFGVTANIVKHKTLQSLLSWSRTYFVLEMGRQTPLMFGTFDPAAQSYYFTVKRMIIDEKRSWKENEWWKKGLAVHGNCVGIFFTLFCSLFFFSISWSCVRYFLFVLRRLPKRKVESSCVCVCVCMCVRVCVCVCVCVCICVWLCVSVCIWCQSNFKTVRQSTFRL